MMIINLKKRIREILFGLKNGRFLFLFFFIFLHSSSFAAASEQAETPIVIGMGDSIGEGVQGADANFLTQPFSYLNIFAWHLNIPFPLPLIASSPLGFIGDVTYRSRIDPAVITYNLSVSGADVHSILYDRANAASLQEIDSETDLVLFPKTGSQIEIAEEIRPPLIICWIGNNDVLSAATSFDQYDGSQMTPIADFNADFDEIVQRLGALGSALIFANIPDVTTIGFLVDREDMIRFLGSDYGLPEGHFTSIVVMLLIRMGIDNGSLIQDPDFVLDANEVQIIRQRTDTFNQLIEEKVSAIGMPVLDVNSLFDFFHENPLFFFGIPLTTRFLGGIFSLDGIHPSNIGHAFLANAFIAKINSHFMTNIPMISWDILYYFLLTDPSVDKDGDGRVTGRAGMGLLETLGPYLGISGDDDDFTPSSFEDQFYPGSDPQVNDQISLEAAISKFKDIFGLKVFERKHIKD